LRRTRFKRQLDPDPDQRRARIELSKKLRTMPELAEQNNFGSIVTCDNDSYSREAMACCEMAEIEDRMDQCLTNAVNHSHQERTRTLEGESKVHTGSGIKQLSQ
jgi:hypothetical protein